MFVSTDSEMSLSQLHRKAETHSGDGRSSRGRPLRRPEGPGAPRPPLNPLSDGARDRDGLERHGADLAVHLQQGSAPDLQRGASGLADRGPAEPAPESGKGGRNIFRDLQRSGSVSFHAGEQANYESKEI